MSITDELREYAERFNNSHDAWSGIGGELCDIADRIDAEHKRAIGYVDDRDPETMVENGWVRLPKDADGEYIRVGDAMEWPDGEAFEVVGVGNGVLFYAQNESHAEWTGASNKRHHKPPTVEDVLREMLYKAHIYDEREMELLPDLIAEYADKRRLVGENE